MKILKIIGLSLVLLLALLLLAVVALPQLVDTQAFRQQVVNQVKQHTGQELLIEGDLNLSLFPWLGVKTGRLAIAQPEALGEGNWLDIAGADIKVKLLPLLSRQLEVDTIKLRQPKIHYRINKSGLSSLGDLAQSPSGSTKPASENNLNQAGAALALIIAGVSVEDGSLRLDDQQSGQQFELQKLNIETANVLTSGDTETSLAPVSLSGQLQHPELGAANFSLQTQLAVNIEQKLVSLKDFLLHLTLQDVAPQVLQSTVQISQLNVDFKQQKTPPIPFSLSEKTFNVQADGDITLQDWASMLVYKGEVKTQNINLKNILQKLAVEYQAEDENVLQQASFSTHFSGGLKGLSLQDIKIQLDDSLIIGAFSVANFAQHICRFDLDLNQINLDRYLPPEDSENSSTEKTAQDSTLMALVAPFAIFEAVPTTGVLRAKSLQANGVKLQDINVGIESANKQVTITPKAKLYEGALDATLAYENRSSGPHLKITSDFSKVNLEPLLIDASISDQLSGLASITTDIVLQEQDGQFSQSGSINLNAVDGAITGAGLLQIIDSLDKKLEQECDEARQKYFFAVKSINKRCSSWDGSIEGYRAKKSTGSEDKLLFNLTEAAIQLGNQKINNNRLNIRGDDFSIDGSGAINILQQDLAYQATLNLSNFEKDGQKVNLKIPFEASGSIENPNYRVDYSTFLSSLVGEFKALEKNRLHQKAAERLGKRENSENQTQEEPKDVKEQLKDDLRKKLLNKLFR